MVSRLKLRIELVPKPLWGKNLRSSVGLGKARWDKLRRELIKSNGARCMICGSAENLHGHEVWSHQEKKRVRIAVLLKVEIVCIDCHDIHHWARTVKLILAGVVKHSREIALRKYFRKVNGCRQLDFDNHFLRNMRIWFRQSKKRWRVDWGDFRGQIDVAEAARAKWAQSHRSSTVG